MQGGQGMEDAGMCVCERGPGHPSSLLHPCRPRPRATLPPGRELYLSTLCPSPPLCPPGPRTAPGSPVRPPSPPAARCPGSGPPTPPRPSASPLHLPQPWDPRPHPFATRTPGPSNRPTWRRLPLALSHLPGEQPARTLAVPSHRPRRTSPRLP